MTSSTGPGDDAETTLSVWTYPYADGARRLEQRLSDGSAGDVVVLDGALVTWLPGRATPQVRELQGAARTRSLGVGFWGLLFGIVTAGPDLAALRGDLHATLDSTLSGVGIGREVLSDLRRGLRPGCSAVAVICAEPVLVEIESVSTLQPRGSRPHETGPVRTTRQPLTTDQEAALRRVFSA
ncbi:DUF1269 domain-containing protein [Nocardioides sp.]|uniref:DUF1269 domain-containing protein n=1 Tax=Nocardioides sp. TaxID=35761 RepID=UPI003D0A565D